MYDLQKFTLRDMSECGLALRHLGNKANSMEEASNYIIQYLYENLIEKQSGKNSCVLIRFFKTHSYGELTSELQECTQDLLGNHLPDDSLKCLTLLATAGEQSEWNSRYKSGGHKAIPLANEEAIARIPMIFQLIQQLGLNLGTIVQPDSNLLTDLEQRMYNVFYIPDALGSPYIPSQTSFVIPFNIKSVVGFGGLLPSGNMFVVLMFLRVVIPRITVDLLRPLALNVKMAILPFEDEKIFIEQSQFVVSNEISTATNKDDNFQYLNSKIATLTQLLDVSEQSTINQSDRLEQTNAHLQKTLDKLQTTQIQLVHTEKMSSLGQLVAGIAHEINNPVNFIHGNLIYAKQYTEILLNLIQSYQDCYPNPPKEIQELIKETELSFLAEDLTKIINSMTVGTKRISEIVKSLRNFSRLDEAEVKNIDIHEGIDSTLMILEHCMQARQGYPEIKVIKEYGQLSLIECYPSQLNQVFMNIIANAIDALQNINESRVIGSIEEKYNYPLPKIHICTKALDNKWIAISIADNGCGINEEARSRLFDPFFTTKPIGKGTGIGLSISHQIIVEKHGGKISCISIPGQGAEFLVEIPVKIKN
ncbi:sensor histidine kinase [Komarekiella sp. 'clone 1']|uniref:histidine kinase n=1 Tax=Komarekiella delphini-convector SJRDD-AB1 TaxID=2593771 RepID=A0AA40SYK1_9NOST|nr:ATP-binding protein [Komarekiella delphini-convector]MBD6617368.1 sensor histidine kinase [Komarekiella delphini-convector SJRDD-AB1]